MLAIRHVGRASKIYFIKITLVIILVCYISINIKIKRDSKTIAYKNIRNTLGSFFNPINSEQIQTNDKSNSTMDQDEVKKIYNLKFDSSKKNNRNDDQVETQFDEKSIVSERMEKRRKKLIERCLTLSNNGIIDSESNLGRFYYFYQYKTSICTIAKAGSSTWRTHLRRVNKGPPNNIPADLDPRRVALRKLGFHRLKDYISNTTTIITVRNPLTRLISAYGSKYKNGLIDTYKPRREKRLRKKTAGSTWPERMRQFWLPAYRSNGRLPKDLHIKLNLSQPFDIEKIYWPEVYEKLVDTIDTYISFENFLTHVVRFQNNYNRQDAHWKSYTNCCRPCAFKFDYITKIETLSSDLSFIFKKLKIPGNAGVEKNSKDSERIIGRYQNIPSYLRKKIYNIYKLDFLLFDYKLPSWFLEK